MNRCRTPIAIAVVAVSGLAGASIATAAPAVQSVDVERISDRRVEVTVETLRGTGAVEPRISVRVGKRVARLRDSDWDAAMGADEAVLSSGTLRLRAKAGAALTVRVRVCDDTCASVTRDVVVVPADPADDAPITVPGGPGAPADGVAGITADKAVAIALARVPGGTLIGYERASRPAAGWEVKVAGGDGIRREIVVGPDGAIVREEIEDQRGDGPRPVAPLPIDAVTAERAAEIAVAHVGGGVAMEVKRSRLTGAVWHVEVAQAGVEHEVDVAADGSIVRSVIDD